MKLVVGLTLIIEELFVIEVEHVCEISRLCLVKHSDEVLCRLLPCLWVFNEQSIKCNWHLTCMLEIEEMSSSLVVVNDFVSDRMIIPVVLIARVSFAQLK